MADGGTDEKNELVLTGRPKKFSEEKISREYRVVMDLATNNVENKIEGRLTLKKIDAWQIKEVENMIGNLMTGEFRIIIRPLNSTLAVYDKGGK